MEAESTTESKEDVIVVSPMAYIKSLMYFQRFTSEFVNEDDFKFAYGLLIGYVDPFDNSTNIEDFIPIKDFDKEYIKFRKFDTIFENIDKLNVEFNDDEYPEYILGWARNSLHDDLDPTIFDKKNHLFFQTAINPKSVAWIFNFENLTIDYGFRLYAFKNDVKELTITSELKELKYKMSKNVNFDEFVEIAIDIEEKRKNSEVLIKGIEEEKEESLLGVKFG